MLDSTRLNCACAVAIITNTGIGFVSIAGLPEKTSVLMNDANARYLSVWKREIGEKALFNGIWIYEEKREKKNASDIRLSTIS